MEFQKQTCEDFIKVLGSKEPVPGGGGAVALVGAVGIALGNMVGSLTVGKKKYQPYEQELKELLERAMELQQEFLSLIDEDAKMFLPLLESYRLPKETEDERKRKEEVMEEALRGACRVPLEIMEKSCEAIELHKKFLIMGSKMAISDVGVGVTCCRAALQGAGLSVFINTKCMKDKEYAEKMEARVDAMLEKYSKLADELFWEVRSRF
ncbi:cyclodeaminase/cyclohydrolase family protein [Velocimicrobium porci]|uniref:Cyclodeaminase/cyclohydrolase family protein n=1 Tax=Velocimicrobium porci TaxID=2606634 RepID=A0A6L5XWT9_9FIRM|nr:cyclodeaminase/cyclohydrolase family protein [Velocimicrobium porci]MSS62483.1 cyclodeaminase/cyclohydrolase family protein [Velocimicrobium porci]